MEPAFALVEMPGNHIAKLGRGKPPQVWIEVSLRQGRKKYSTKVRGLEDYGIDPVAFLREVTKRFACSGIVETEPEGRAALKKGCVELDFQGNLAEELQALLLGDEKLSSHGGAKDSEYSLPKSAIDVVLKKNVPTKKPRK
jgi:translation initiation factor 2D